MSDAAGWIVSADTDLDAARRCVADPPNVAVAAYHCQQAAEKLIKAVLVALCIPYPRGRSGHDLGLAAAQIPSGHELREVPRRSTQSQTGRFRSATRPAIRYRPNRCPSRVR